jgi:GNAT superfamily N-acetyltransferase
MNQIQRVDAGHAARWLPELVILLRDAVDSGASVGFLAPLSDADARKYWAEVFAEVGQKRRILLAAVQDSMMVGSVQLALAMTPNAWHRAEVQKLLVLRSYRRQGLGQALMLEVERVARQEGRHLLVLDTRVGRCRRTLGVSCCRKRKRSGRCRQSAARR